MTHDQYVYAVRSNRVPQAALLPTETPRISVWYRSGIDSQFRFDRDCLVAGPWLNQSERVYNSFEKQIRDLVNYKSQIWRHHCEKGMFFPVSIVERADTLPLPDGADLAQMDDVADVAELDDFDVDLPDSVDDVSLSGSNDDVPQLDIDDMFQVDE